MKLLRLIAVAIGCLALAGCVAESTWAPEDAVQRAAFAPEGPARIVLLTAISNSNGSGGHSALLIDGGQRVLFDPAGTWRHPDIPERNDVLYGMSPPYFQFYMDYHARESYHMVVQELVVSADLARRLSAVAQSHGAVGPARCARAVSAILASQPEFASISGTFFPRALMRDFGEIPGVQVSQVFDDDSDDNLELLQRQAALRRVAEEATTHLNQ